MEFSDEEFRRISALIEGRVNEPSPQERLRDARARLSTIAELTDSATVAPGGRAAAVDLCFRNMFLPSEIVRTQLRLARHYIEAADDGNAPQLHSFVVLRVAIECMATAHWLISDPSHRVRVERFLKRMWWDTQSAVEIARVSDANPDLSAVHVLEKTIREIATPIKGLDPTQVTSSKRVLLSGIVAEASRAIRPEDPTLLQSVWMTCAGVSHGNIPLSAGVGVTPHSVRNPSQHPIEASAYVGFTEMVVNDLHTTVELFQKYAAEVHEHRRPGR